MNTVRVERSSIDMLPSAVIVLAVAAIAVIGGMATDTTSLWYLGLDKPAWQPPNWLFGPVWTALYILLAWSALIVWHHTAGKQRRQLMWLYGFNGALNLAWTFIFFQAHSAFWAGVEIVVMWGTIVAMMARAWPVSRPAASMLLPYLLWVGFASALTWAIAGAN